VLASAALSRRRSYTLPTSRAAGVSPLDRQITKCLEVALDLEFDFADARRFESHGGLSIFTKNMTGS